MTSLRKFRALALALVLPAAVLAQEAGLWLAQETTPSSSVDGDGTYVVKRWDTLWDLAHQYLSDPFKWPDIHRLNPQIANPNLIFPGDRIRLPGAGLDAPAGVEGLQSQQRAALGRPDFSELTKGIGAASGSGVTDTSAGAPDSSWNSDETSQFVESRLLQSLITKNFFSPHFLEKVAFLWFDKDAKGRISPGTGAIAECNDNSVFRGYDKIKVDAYAAGTYAVGDIVEIFHSDGLLRFGGATANLVHRVARARIVNATPGAVQAEITKVWDIVRCNDRVAAAEPPVDRTIGELAPVGNPVEATVFRRVETTESPYPYQTFIIDRGATHGVALGDIFAVYPVKKKIVSENASLVACVVHVGESSSTLVVVKMFENLLGRGDAARLISRIQFKE